MIPINTLRLGNEESDYPEFSKGNSHVPKVIADTYPQMSFKGKPFYLTGHGFKRFVRAKYRDIQLQMEIGECFYYSFKDDFFYFASDFISLEGSH